MAKHDRTMILARVADGESQAKIAESLGISRQRVGQILGSASLKQRLRMSKSGGGIHQLAGRLSGKAATALLDDVGEGYLADRIAQIVEAHYASRARADFLAVSGDGV